MSLDTPHTNSQIQFCTGIFGSVSKGKLASFSGRQVEAGEGISKASK